jgi:hypothetical protein
MRWRLRLLATDFFMAITLSAAPAPGGAGPNLRLSGQDRRTSRAAPVGGTFN